LVGDLKEALFGFERAEKVCGGVGQLNLKWMRASVGASVIGAFGLGSAFKAEGFVAGAFAFNGFDGVGEAN
jgi:hypothetical protein